jgi:membrane dipeptidase
MDNKVPLIFDGHLDLSMNAMEWNRDLRLPIAEIRRREKGMSDKPDRGLGTVSFPEMKKGRVGICVGTMIARYVKPGNPIPGWNSPEQAWAQTQAQLAWYKAMEDAGELVQIRDKKSLMNHKDLWVKIEDTGKLTVGYVLSLEGADSIVNLSYLEKSYSAGLRAIGPAHYGPGTYAYGTDSTGGLGPKGRELLKEMDRLGIILDATHLCDESFWEALNIFKGPVWASHNNSRVLVSHNRQFSDDQAKALFERGAVIGVVFDAWMLVPGWDRGKDTPRSRNVTLNSVIDQIDYYCQLAGNSDHVGIGSDLDGAFGKEQCPRDLNTIADLQKIPGILKQRNYPDQDIEKIMYLNWIRFLERSW